MNNEESWEEVYALPDALDYDPCFEDAGTPGHHYTRETGDASLIYGNGDEEGRDYSIMPTYIAKEIMVRYNVLAGLDPAVIPEAVGFIADLPGAFNLAAGHKKETLLLGEQAADILSRLVRHE